MFYNFILSLRNTPLMDSKASWTFVRVSLVFPVANVSVRLTANREVFEKSGRRCRSIRGADPLVLSTSNLGLGSVSGLFMTAARSLLGN